MKGRGEGERSWLGKGDWGREMGGMEGKFNIPVRSPIVVRAGTALESIQKETHDIITCVRKYTGTHY